jgi:uncharacterized damage-inducible protein DinB
MTERTDPSAGAAPSADRTDPPLVADERATLLGFLDYQRQTLAWKCAGLQPEQLARRAVPPSELSLLGLLRHLAEVERGWFRGFAGEPTSYLYATEEDPDLDFHGAVADPAVVEAAYADWRAEIHHAHDILAGAQLDDTFTRQRDGNTFSLRWVLAHMIEEYARHNGHADLLRERIDGATGE